MSKRLGQTESRQYLLMFLPAIVVVVAVGIIPVCSVFGTSLLRWELVDLDHPRFIGFGNFIKMMGDTRFINSLKVQLFMSFGSVFLQLLVGCLLALLFNSANKLVRIFRGIVVVPHVIPPVAVGLIWLTLLTPAISPINSMMIRLGLGNPAWLTTANLALGALIVADAWWGFPFTAIIMLSALQSVPVETLESADIDGANSFQKVIFVILPMVSWSLVMCAILRIIDSFKSFPLIFIMTNGGPGMVTEVTNFYAYNNAFQYGHFGYASAISSVMFVFSALLSFVILKANRSVLYR